MKERSTRRKKVKGFLTVSGEKAAADDKNDKKPPHCPLCTSSHDLDECRNFNKWKYKGGANSYLNRSYVMGAMKRYRNHILLVIAQFKEPARYVLVNTKLVFMASS